MNSDIAALLKEHGQRLFNAEPGEITFSAELATRDDGAPVDLIVRCRTDATARD